MKKARQKQVLYYLTYMWNHKTKTKKTKLVKEIRLVVIKGRGWVKGELEEGGHKVQTSSYKISKYEGCNVQHDNYS